MNKHNKGFAPLIAIIIIVAGVLIGGGATYYYYKTKIQPVVQEQQIQNQQQNTQNNSVKPSITVISPNGGETLIRGKTYNITWTSSNLSNTDKIFIELHSLDNRINKAYNVTTSISNLLLALPSAQSGSYNWTVSNDTPIGTKYKINMYVYTAPELVSIVDESDNYFSIITPSTNQVSTWKTYTNSQYGFLFQYPTGFSTTFAQFQQSPNAIITTQTNLKLPANIDDNGCYAVNTAVPVKDSQVMINNMQFCVSQGGDAGAGQAYTSYYYTTFKNGNYYTLQYVVHTSNGCGAYMDTPNYQGCMDFFKNYDTIVVKPIQDSVATFKFTPVK